MNNLDANRGGCVAKDCPYSTRDNMALGGAKASADGGAKVATATATATGTSVVRTLQEKDFMMLTRMTDTDEDAFVVWNVCVQEEEEIVGILRVSE